MKLRISRKFLAKLVTIHMMVLVSVANLPLQAFAAPVVDLKADGQDSLVLSDPTQVFTLSVDTVDALDCQLTSPANTGLATNTSMPIAPGNPFYPTSGGSVIFTVICEDSLGDTSSDSVTVS